MTNVKKIGIPYFRSPSSYWSQKAVVSCFWFALLTFNIEIYSLILCFEIQTIEISGNKTEWTGILAKTCLYNSLDLDLQIWLLVRKDTGTFKKEAPGQVTGFICSWSIF